MNKLIAVAVILLGLSASANFNTALDCSDFLFTTGGDAEWFAQSDIVKIGETALQSGEISDNQETWLETTVSGEGMVSFWWKASSESVAWDYLAVSVDGEQRGKIGGTNGGWMYREVVVVGDGEHIVRWTYEKDSYFSGGRDCGWLDAVAWTAAPASMTISFRTNGGEVLAPTTVSPGARYGELPFPCHDTMVFLGWYLDEELTQKVDDEAFILFKDHTLYAKWGRPVEVMNKAGVEFSASEESCWYARADMAGQYVATMFPSGAYEYGEWMKYALNIATHGYGTLDFSIKSNSKRESNVKISLNGDLVEDGYYYKSSAKKKSLMCLPTNLELDNLIAIWFDHDLGGDTDEQIVLSDFTWTPAPEAMTVSFNVEGGTGALGPLTYEPGDVYGNLPVPSREGCTFLGWHYNGTKVEEGDLVPFCASITLDAKWAANEIAVLPDAFYDVECDANYMRQIVMGDGTSYLEADLCWDVDWDDWDWTDSEFGFKPLLSANMSEGGFLAFDFCAPDNLWYSSPDDLMKFRIDGVSVVPNIAEMKIKGDDSKGWYRVRINVPAGTHTVSWVFFPIYSGSMGGGGVWLRNFSFERFAPQNDLATWSGKAFLYRSWITNDLDRFARSYADRIAANGADYEARIFHAVSILANLAESEEFKSYADRFGFSIDYARLMFTGKADIEGQPDDIINNLADDALSLIAPVIAEAKEDLAAIPDGWTGVVKVSAEEWPVDEDVYIDVADVLFARASLDCGLAALNYLAACDLTVDWEVARASYAAIDRSIPTNREGLVKRMIDEQTAFLATVRNRECLAASRENFKSALELALSADTKASARGEDGMMHFIEYDPLSKDELAFARAKTQFALQSLDSAMDVDFNALVQDFSEIYTARVDETAKWQTLLPVVGIQRVYLGALFEGGITRDLLPKTRLNEEGKIVPNFYSMRDPTFGGILPDMTADEAMRIATAIAPGRDFECVGHVLSFDANGGQSDSCALYFLDGEVFGRMPSNPVRVGYEFTGWFVNGQRLSAEVLMTDEDITAVAQWTANKYTVVFDTNGGEGDSSAKLSYGSAISAPTVTRMGYTFAGWSPEVPATVPVGGATYTAQWAPNQYTVTFDANGGRGAMPAQTFSYDEMKGLSECAFERSAHEFVGWALSADSDDIAYLDGEIVENLSAVDGDIVRLYAIWERTSLWAPVVKDDGSGSGSSGDSAFSGLDAEIYDGYVYNSSGMLVGMIQAKTAKAKVDKKTNAANAKIAVVIQLVGEKKQTLKGDMDAAVGVFDAADKSGRALHLEFGANGVSGTYGDYLIDGAENKFSSKDPSDKAAAAATLAKWSGVYAVAWPDGTGWSEMRLTVAAKGKVKAAGILANGAKASTTSTLLVGDDGVCMIPVVVTKKVALAFSLWLTPEGLSVVGLPDGAIVGRAGGALKSGAAFHVSKADTLWSSISGTVIADYIPDGAEVTSNGGKWVLPKAGKVVYKNGAVDESKLGENPSGLKLTYKAKDGSFNGSFKVYSVNGAKAKATTVNVTGVVIDGVGYGTATIKKVGGVAVTIE